MFLVGSTWHSFNSMTRKELFAKIVKLVRFSVILMCTVVYFSWKKNQNMLYKPNGIGIEAYEPLCVLKEISQQCYISLFSPFGIWASSKLDVIPSVMCWYSYYLAKDNVRGWDKYQQHPSLYISELCMVLPYTTF